MIEYLHRRFGWPKVILFGIWPVLWVLSLLFGLVVALKNLRWNLFPPSKIGSSYVISIGNLSAGGTGKTPMGLAMIHWMLQRGLNVEVVLRGYAAKGGFSDEAELYRKALGADKVHQEADRCLALKTMVSPKADVVILDDAFQHRRVHRDLDIVLWDLSAPLSESEVLPLGMLRESKQGLSRSHAVVMTRSDSIDDNQKQQTLSTFRDKGWGGQHFLAFQSPTNLRHWPTEEMIETIEQPCFLVSGIGRPEAFLATTQKMGLNVTGYHWFADHHAYSQEEIDLVWAEAEERGATEILITSKDAVKWQDPRRVVVLEIETKVEPEFWEWVEKEMERSDARR